MAWTDTIGNLQSLNISNLWGDIIGSILFWGQIILIIIAIAFAAFLIYQIYFKYTIRVTLHKRIGIGSVGISEERARIHTTKDGMRRLSVWGKKHGSRLSGPVPAGKFRNRKGKRDHYHLIIDDNLQLHPMSSTINWEDPKLTLEAQDQRIFARQEDKRRLTKWDKEQKWKELIAPATMIIALLLIFLMAYFGFEKLGESMYELASRIGQVASACTVQ